MSRFWIIWEDEVIDWFDTLREAQQMRNEYHVAFHRTRYPQVLDSEKGKLR